MANIRKKGKQLIGAQAPPELHAAIDCWRARNQNSSVTFFLLSACVEKLQRDGVPINTAAVFADHRFRLPSAYPDYTPSRIALNDKPVSLRRL